MNICPSMASMIIKKRSQCKSDEKIVARGNMVEIVPKTKTDKLIERIFHSRKEEGK